MSTATLSNAPATQLTFPWAIPKAECEPLIVADCSAPADGRLTSDVNRRLPLPETAVAEVSSLKEAMVGDRIGKPFRVGAIMFRLLKSYGITDEEIAEGIAQYTAKQHTAKQHTAKPGAGKRDIEMQSVAHRREA